MTYVAITHHKEDVHLYMDKIARQKRYRLNNAPEPGQIVSHTKRRWRPQFLHSRLKTQRDHC